MKIFRISVFCSLVYIAVTCHDNGRDYDLGQTYLSSDGCNECICTVNGAACTLMSCWQNGAGVGNTHIPRCYYHGRVYTVGDSFWSVDGCNRCICSEKEVAVCTMMFCPPSTLQPPESTKTPQCVYNGKVHSIGDSFKSIDGCNTCRCVGNEQVACTLMLCLTTNVAAMTTTTEPSTIQQTAAPTPRPVTKCVYNGRTYSDGDSFKADDGCNTCRCLAIGKIACTKMLCPKTTKTILTGGTSSLPPQSPSPKATSTSVPMCNYNGYAYIVGGSFKADDGCNTCKCIGDEQVACTKMLCPPTSKTSMTPVSSMKMTTVDQPITKPTPVPKCDYNGHVYSVGNSFKAADGCNTCRCTADQQVACTKMYCPTTILRLPTTVQPVVTSTSRPTSTSNPTTTVQPVVTSTSRPTSTSNPTTMVQPTEKTTDGSVPITTINHLKMTMN